MDIEPANLIVSALTAGAIASVKDTTSQAIKDTYNALKSLIQRKLSHQAKAQKALLEYEDNPDIYEEPVRKALSTLHLDQDEEVLTTAHHLMSLVQPQQVAYSKYHTQNTSPVQGQVIGDHASVTQNFGDAPKP
jgi:hypothetical protein